jgi:hypothetical protein
MIIVPCQERDFLLLNDNRDDMHFLQWLECGAFQCEWNGSKMWKKHLVQNVVIGSGVIRCLV